MFYGERMVIYLRRGFGFETSFMTILIPSPSSRMCIALSFTFGVKSGTESLLRPA